MSVYTCVEPALRVNGIFGGLRVFEVPSHGQGTAHVQISRLVGTQAFLCLWVHNLKPDGQNNDSRQRIKRCVLGFDKSSISTAQRSVTKTFKAFVGI